MNTLNNDLLQGIVVFIDNTRLLTFRSASVQFKTVATDRFSSLQTRELNAVHSVMNSCKLNTHAVLTSLKFLSEWDEIDGGDTTLIIKDFTHVLTCINSIIELCMTNNKAYDNSCKPIFAPGYYEIGNYAYNAYWSFSKEIMEDMYFSIHELCVPVYHPDNEYEELYDENGYNIYVKHPEIGAHLNKMWKDTKFIGWF